MNFREPVIYNKQWDCDIYSDNSIEFHTTIQRQGERYFVAYYGSMPCYDYDYDEYEYDLELLYWEWCDAFAVPEELCYDDEQLTPELINDALNQLIDKYNYDIRKCLEKIQQKAQNEGE